MSTAVWEPLHCHLVPMVQWKGEKQTPMHVQIKARWVNGNTQSCCCCTALRYCMQVCDEAAACPHAPAGHTLLLPLSSQAPGATPSNDDACRLARGGRHGFGCACACKSNARRFHSPTVSFLVGQIILPRASQGRGLAIPKTHRQRDDIAGKRSRSPCLRAWGLPQMIRAPT